MQLEDASSGLLGLQSMTPPLLSCSGDCFPTGISGISSTLPPAGHTGNRKCYGPGIRIPKMYDHLAHNSNTLTEEPSRLRQDAGFDSFWWFLIGHFFWL
ncbi:hypothetical protein ACLKA6_014924 [Drosophila palustris]